MGLYISLHRWLLFIIWKIVGNISHRWILYGNQLDLFFFGGGSNKLAQVNFIWTCVWLHFRKSNYKALDIKSHLLRFGMDGPPKAYRSNTKPQEVFARVNQGDPYGGLCWLGIIPIKCVFFSSSILNPNNHGRPIFSQLKLNLEENCFSLTHTTFWELSLVNFWIMGMLGVHLHRWVSCAGQTISWESKGTKNNPIGSIRLVYLLTCGFDLWYM